MKLKRLLFHCLTALLISLFLSTPGRAGVIIKDKLPSLIMAREYIYTIYLPDGYETSNLRYPVLYLLHGSGGDENSWAVSGKIQPTADALIASGAIPPAIIVMPAHKNAWWVDGNKEPAETVFIKELIPYIDATYRTISEKEGRLVAGLSAGGYGTVNFVLKYPEMFAAGARPQPGGVCASAAGIVIGQSQHPLCGRGG